MHERNLIKKIEMTNTLYPEHDSQYVLVNLKTKRVVFCRSLNMVKSEMMGQLNNKWQVYKREEDESANTEQ